MDTNTHVESPLRQRMIDDMRMRKFEPKTQSHYLRRLFVNHVDKPDLVAR